MTSDVTCIWCGTPIHPVIFQEPQDYRGQRAAIRKRLAVNLNKHIVWFDETEHRVCYKCPTAEHLPI